MKKMPKNDLNQWIGSLPKNSWSSTKESNIKFEEQKSKIVFVNKKDNECLKINVDGGVVSAKEQSFRCDKLLVQKSYLQFCFIELKGGDIGDSKRDETVKIFERQLNCSEYAGNVYLIKSCSEEKRFLYFFLNSPKSTRRRTGLQVHSL